MYRKILYENLISFYKSQEESQDVTIEAIDNIEIFNDITYDFYYTLFYTDSDGWNKYLVIGDDIEIDEYKTENIENCLKKGLINFKKNEKINHEIEMLAEKKESGQKIAYELANDGLDTTKPITIQKQEHPRFLQEAFKKATKSVCITSPWVRYNVLKRYEKDIENSLKAGIHIYLNYGIEKGAKDIIDKEAKSYLDELSRKYKNLHINSDANTHEKILICDDKWVITGSFNWFSYDGSGERAESSVLNVDKSIINTFKQKFI